MDKVFKICVVGDGAVGKTCLLYTYAHNHFPKEYIPTVFDNFENSEKYDNQNYTLQLFDTAGQEEYDEMRKLSYPDTHCFIICFGVASPTSLLNVYEKWYKDLQEVFRTRDISTPILLVGCKSDLRKDKKFLKKLLKEKNIKPVNEEEIEKMRKKIRAFDYVECSSMERVNERAVFQKCLAHLVEKRRRELHKKEGSSMSFVQKIQNYFNACSGNEDEDELLKNRDTWDDRPSHIDDDSDESVEEDNDVEGYESLK